MIRHFLWPGLRLMLLPFSWIAAFFGFVMMISVLGSLLGVASGNDPNPALGLVGAFGAATIAAVMFKLRRLIKYTR